MKPRLFISVLFLFINFSAISQWTNILPNNNSYGSCFATSPDTCFVGSGAGHIFRTIDGGTTWDSVQTIFIYSQIIDICFPSANVGYACGGSAFGDKSIIVKTTNAGQTWDSLTSNAFGFAFSKVFCVNDSVAFFAGDAFVKTMDGGQSFSTISPPTISWVMAIHFFDLNNGLISSTQNVSSSKSIYRISRTSDGGMNWTTSYLDSSDNSSFLGQKHINAIAFRNPLNGCAVRDNGYLLNTSDGGLSWIEDSLVNDSINLLKIVFSKNSLRGYVAATKYTGSTWQGRIYRTDNGGSTWQENFNTVADGFYGISMGSDNVVYAAGYGPVFKTTNGGVGIQEYSEEKNEIRIYPNPLTSSSILQLNTQLKNAEVVIYDMLGKEMLRRKMDGNRMEIEKGSLESGVYFVWVSSEESQWVMKIVVE